MEEIEISLARALSPELEGARDLGSVSEESDFAIRIATSPICHQLTSIFEALERPVPKDLRLYDRFSLWLVPHRLGVLRRQGLAEPVSVDIEVEYQADGETCSVVGLLPSPEFVRYGSIAANVSIGGSVQATGACVPDGDTGVGKADGTEIKAFAGLKFSAVSSGSVGLEFSAVIVTPYISAVGLGSDRAEWTFVKNKEALFGRDIETWCILALSKRRKELKYRMRFNVRTRTLFFPTSRQSEWVDVKCVLG